MGQRSRALRAGAAAALMGLLATPAFAAPAAGPAGGTPDPTFGGGDGQVDLPTEQAPIVDDGTVSAVVRAPDGSIRVAWTTEAVDAPSRVSKYSAAGVVDAAFGADGTVVVDGDIGHDGLAVRPDGSTVVAVSDHGPGHLLQLDGQGEPDASFSADGVVEIGSTFAGVVRLRADGSLLTIVSGLVVAFDEEGEPEPGFAYGGPTEAKYLDLLVDGRVVVGVDHPAVGEIVVLEASGSLDADVGEPGQPGVVDIGVSGSPNRVVELRARPTGGFYAIVGEDLPPPDRAFALAFTPTGARDPRLRVGRRRRPQRRPSESLPSPRHHFRGRRRAGPADGGAAGPHVPGRGDRPARARRRPRPDVLRRWTALHPQRLLRPPSSVRCKRRTGVRRQRGQRLDWLRRAPHERWRGRPHLQRGRVPSHRGHPAGIDTQRPLDHPVGWSAPVRGGHVRRLGIKPHQTSDSLGCP